MTESEPSSSSRLTSNETTGIEEDDVEFTLNIKDEEAEIARLELPSVKKMAEEQPSTSATEDDDRVPKIEFHCSKCDMKEMVHYYGKTPSFVCGVKFLEDTYIMRDPFQPPPPRWKPKAEYFVALGANCAKCERTVCRDSECSFYYTATYCIQCAQQNSTRYPIETQTRLRKQLATV